MSDTVIKVENVSKLYRLGEIGTGTMGQDINRWFAKVRGKEDPFALLGETNDRTTKGSCEIVWALKDINFEVKQGEVLGIIGNNGAGKSTLLKLLSKVTTPSSGSIKYKGRIASLLEVGTGFHPDLTGRENVFLNGAILGMTKAEIKKRFDEIVDFAGIERYIDTPVKRYSSGMYVRLAFAVAAFLEPEILIIDEVLAVGDAEFQKKCLGRMHDVSTKDGRTVLFVSHNISAIRSLCNKSILLNNGIIQSHDNTRNVINDYFDTGFNLKSESDVDKYRAYDIKHSPIFISSISVLEMDSLPKLELWEKISIKIIIKCRTQVDRGSIQIFFFNSEGISTDFAYSGDDNFFIDFKNEGFYQLIFTPSSQNLAPGKYTIGVGLTPSDHSEAWDAIHHYPIFEIINKGQINLYSDRPWAIHNSMNNQWGITKI